MLLLYFSYLHRINQVILLVELQRDIVQIRLFQRPESQIMLCEQAYLVVPTLPRRMRYEHARKPCAVKAGMEAVKLATP